MEYISEIEDVIKKIVSKSHINHDQFVEIIKSDQVKNMFTPEMFNVETPISHDGDILFNDNYQKLKVYVNGVYDIKCGGRAECYVDSRAKFAWIKICRSELKGGDVAYRLSHGEPRQFDNARRVCFICINNYRFLIGNNCVSGNSPWDYWYKLVRRSDM